MPKDNVEGQEVPKSEQLIQAPTGWPEGVSLPTHAELRKLLAEGDRELRENQHCRGVFVPYTFMKRARRGIVINAPTLPSPETD